MGRLLTMCLYAASLIVLVPGCAHMVETRAIEAFSQSLNQAVKASDSESETAVAELKSTTSDNFREKALRLEASIDDFKNMNIPHGETTVLNVEDISPDVKIVEVGVARSKDSRSRKKVKYRLVRDPQSSEWVVDDLYLKQTADDVKAVKSVNEQMDLLLTVREFMSALSDGDRQKVTSLTSGELTETLDMLPELYFHELARRVTGGQQPSRKWEPRARTDEDVAIVTIRRSVGELTVTCERVDGAWKVGDVAAESRNDSQHVESMQGSGEILLTIADFLEGYSRQEHARLEQACTEHFYSHALVGADLSQVALPASIAETNDLKIFVRDPRAEIIWTTENEVVKLSLTGEVVEGRHRYWVEDVALYDLGSDSSQERKLSAIFTAKATTEVFAEALAQRDLKVIKQLSTSDFQDRVWTHCDEHLTAALPMPEIEDAPVEILETFFKGAVTEINVIQGSTPLTYILRSHSGELRIDDVLIPVPSERSMSLKYTLERVVPAYCFAAAIENNDVATLRRWSSSDFNNMVWLQADRILAVGYEVPQHVIAHPVVATSEEDDVHKIVLGDPENATQIELRLQHDRFVIDEIYLPGTSPSENEGVVASGVKAVMRDQMAFVAREKKAPITVVEKPARQQSVDRSVEHVEYENDYQDVLEPSSSAFDQPVQDGGSVDFDSSGADSPYEDIEVTQPALRF